MLRCVLSLLLVALLIAAADGQARDDYYQEPFRPQFHFTPERNWMNDPNGLVYYQGEYHLFYQYNPFGNDWGHMSWGHAVSTDLLHWQHLPVALAEENGVMIFSGSAVVDRNNTSGLCRNPDPKDKSCLIAIYTGHTEQNQSQHIAVSNDRGRTWTKYAGNPVLDIGYRDFRDPKVIWHEATKKWVMVVSLSREQKVRFYGSADLKKWELLSEFGGAGVADKDVQWECPDLFALPVDGQPGKKKWVLIVNINPGGVAGGSGGQYFIGSFDGRRFTNDNPPERKMFLDYGRDFYAAVTFSDIPKSDGRRILIGWMSNWQYAGKEPTSPWRTAQSVPRVLSLKRFSDGLRLAQQPVAELQRLRDRHFEKPEEVRGDALEIIAEFQTSTGRQPLIRLVSGPDAATIIGYDAATERLFIDRSRSGLVDFDPNFPGTREAPMKLRQQRLKLRVLVDRSSVEIFSADGQVAVTERIFPLNNLQTVEIVAAETQARCVAFDAWQLKSVWRK
ncbi:MAG TPA: glycoside hydrolase family 32 protein [Blastocatellia bacterium]|nr:glycoside hydrolase family 32 protein [Blastocatellia bacterium]